MRLIYYSLARSENGDYDSQWIQSIRSLRNYNQSVPVCIFVFNGATDFILNEAERQRVRVIQLGSYSNWLQKLHVHGKVLSLYPTLHKFFALSEVDTTGVDRALYLDCDTFFFDDPEILFDKCSAAHWFAREAPASRLCPHGYDPANVNEELLDLIAHNERLRRISPFNSGVCLLSYNIWETFHQIRETYLDLAWRLMVGRHCFGRKRSDDSHIQRAVIRAATESDLSRALPYPSDNFWILEEVAYWLALGTIDGLHFGSLNNGHVLQGYEFEEEDIEAKRPVLAHYFSCFQSDFFSKIPAFES
jgi:hypothetical protein